MGERRRAPKGPLPAASPANRTLGVGDAAPAFEADSTAGAIRLADYRARKNVLLAFYPKDFTGG